MLPLLLLALAADSTRADGARIDSARVDSTSNSTAIVAPAIPFARAATLPAAGVPRLPALRLATSTTSAPLAFSDTGPQRPRAVEYSEWYGRRLVIHRIGSFAMLPVFATEYVLGQKLMNDSPVSNGVRSAHVATATGLGVLFGVNTVTGAWNLYDSRHDPAGRTRRFIHSALMLASDAGFAYTGAIAEGEDDGEGGGGGGDDSRRHRAAALTSMGISVAGTVMMWLWKD